VLEDTAFSADVTFAKDAGGESTVVGQFVSETGVARGIGRIHGGRVYAYQADSHEKAQQRGRQEIAHLVDMLSVRPREESIEGAHRLYKIALQRGFTRGRRTAQVAGACLYLICRQDAKPFLLIDFSDALQVNVFTLGAVFLQLAKLLRVADHPTFAKPVDPSLYIHRFADRLDFGRSMHSVANTALRLVASMKRDWIQTGRRPSGICGAALYIAAHIHGFERSIRDVVGVVHIGEHTLSKRLYEFSSTSASAYTADEFDARAREIEAQESAALEAAQPAEAPVGLLEGGGCEHLRMGEAHFAHAMCRACYLEFMQASGRHCGPSTPPAWQRRWCRALRPTNPPPPPTTSALPTNTHTCAPLPHLAVQRRRVQRRQPARLRAQPAAGGGAAAGPAAAGCALGGVSRAEEPWLAGWLPGSLHLPWPAPCRSWPSAASQHCL
jgi:transcription factor IIIB subunit 2